MISVSVRLAQHAAPLQGKKTSPTRGSTLTVRQECLCYLRRAPTSSSLVEAARTRRASGATEAATIMPFDSTPRGFRGAGFTTTTTFRAASASRSLELGLSAAGLGI